MIPLRFLATLSCHVGDPVGNPSDSVADDTLVEDSTEPDLEQILGPGLLLHGVQTCLDPAARDALGPLEPWDLSKDWVEGEIAAWSDDALYGPGIAVADFDGDQAFDVVTANKDVVLYMAHEVSGGELTWTNESKERLPSHVPQYARSATAVDYDGDGDNDLFVANMDKDFLWENDGTGHFVDRTSEAGFRKKATLAGQGSTWADVDGDGDLDVFVSNRRSGDVPSPPDPADTNVFYENRGDGTFAERTGLFAEEARVGYTFVSSFHDFDGDLDPDLYVVNDYGSLIHGNRYLRNDSVPGNIVFTDITDSVGLGLVINGMGLGVGDLNGDVYPDLVVTDWGRLHLMESMDGVWYDVASNRELRPDLYEKRWVSWGVELQDLDNDGLSDVSVVYGPSAEAELASLFGENPDDEPDDIYQQQEDGTFRSVGDAWGWNATSSGRALLAVDLDHDGWLDLFVKSFDERAQYHRQRCGGEAWLEVELVGEAPNTAGIGARVTVEAGERTWQRWIQVGGTSLAASGPPVAHFGLGELDTIDRLTVTWRDGTVSLFQVIDTRQAVTVYENPP
jgi:hypothetical protein